MKKKLELAQIESYNANVKHKSLLLTSFVERTPLINLSRKKEARMPLPYIGLHTLSQGDASMRILSHIIKPILRRVRLNSIYIKK